MTSTEDFFIQPSEQLSTLLSGSSTVDFPLEEPEVVAALELGVCSSPPPPPPQSSFVVPCPLSVELSLSPLPVLHEVDESSALSTAAAIAATGSTPSFSAAVAPSSLSIQLPTAWPEVPRESRHPPVVTPRSPDSTRTSLRKKRPTKKALAAAAAANTTKSTLTARLMSSNTAPIPPPALLKQEEEQCGTTEIVAGQQPPQPQPMVAQPPVVQQPPPPPQSSSSVASNPPPPTTHHHIHHHQQQQQPSHNKTPPPPVQENTGRWTAEEHRLFLQGLEQHGKGWKKIASLIKSRTVVQIRTHAQKYFQKLAKARQNGEQVGGVMDGSAAGGGNGNHGQVTMATRDEGTSTSSYPQVTMRTISHHAGNGGNMSIGSDPTSLAAAAGHVGIADSGALGGRKRRAGSNPGGSTKRRAIGSVVRSSVREGRNAKRQTKAARKRKSKQQAELDGHNYAEEEVDVPNPLPAISQVLDPYMPLPPPPGTLTANGPNTTGRNQLVNTATHNTLPMAALEDAVFRLLTPATGAPVPPVPAAQNINDPLAPNTVKPPQGPSPVGVDQQLYPSWVDAKNPPAWYNDGGDIETLLEDADCLNWLNDTGDLEETYPPAVVEPSPVTSGDGANAAGSHESLSFLVDPPHQEGATTDDAATADSGTASVNPTTTITAEADSKPAAVSITATTEEYSSATEAMAAVQQKQEVAVKEEPLFPDLDVGDDQEFVSALLENQGQSHLSFSKLHSELHAGDEQQQ